MAAPNREEPPATAAEPDGAGDDASGDRRLLRASGWSVLNYAGSQGLRFVGNVILWRLLFEEVFGIMALVNALLQALQMFSDVGIGPSIVQNERGEDPDFLNTAWTVQVIRGGIIWLISLAVAVPMAEFYDQPILVEVIPVVGLTAVAQGFLSTRLFTVQRNLNLGRMTALKLGGQLVATTVMIGWALVWPSVWALAVGGIAGAVVKLALSHTLLPGVRNRFRWDKVAFRELVTFGRWIFLSTLLTFLALQSDRLIFGKLVPIAVLGVYSIAQALATLPSFLLSGLVHQAVFPHLSRQLDRGAAIADVYRKVRVPVAILAGWLFTCLLAGGPTLVRVLYGERAVEAGWMLQLLAAGSWFAALRVLGGSPLLALGVPKWHAAANAAKVVGMIILIPVGHHLYGFFGAVLGFALADLGNYAVVLIATHLYGLRSIGQDLALTLSIAVIGAAALGVRTACRGLGLPPLAEGIVLAVVITAAWAVVWKLRGPLTAIGASAPDPEPDQEPLAGDLETSAVAAGRG